MEETLVKSETAKLAKNKGFDEVCNHLWNFSRHNKLEACINKNSELNKDRNWYSAPTQALLQKWLRENHDIDTYVTLSTQDTNPHFPRKEYEVYINYKKTTLLLGFKTYEEALEVGLFKSLKLIK